MISCKPIFEFSFIPASNLPPILSDLSFVLSFVTFGYHFFVWRSELSGFVKVINQSASKNNAFKLLRNNISEADSQNLKRACANRQILLRAAKFVELEKVNEPKLGQHCEIAWWNWLTCLVGPQSSESVDWGPSILNRSKGVLGVCFVTQLTGYPNFGLVFLFVW